MGNPRRSGTVDISHIDRKHRGLGRRKGLARLAKAARNQGCSQLGEDVIADAAPRYQFDHWTNDARHEPRSGDVATGTLSSTRYASRAGPIISRIRSIEAAKLALS